MTFLAIFKMNFFSIITYLNSSFWIHWFLELTLSKYLKLKKLPGTMEPRPKRYFRVSYFFFFKLRESNQFSSVQSLSRVWLFATQWTAAFQASLPITNSRILLKLTSIESVMPYNHLKFCHPLLLLTSIFPSIMVFSNGSALHTRWPKYWSFNFNISPSYEHSGLISSRMNWLDLLAVQGTLKSLLQYHSWKASILLPSALFAVQLSYPYMTTGKIIAFTRWIYWDKVTSLLFNMLSRLVIIRSQQTVENCSRDGNIRSPSLRPEKSVCRSRSKS